MQPLVVILPRPLSRGVERSQELGLSFLAASIAFYALLSLFPFVLLLVRVLLLMEAHVAVESFVLSISEPYFPDYQDFIATVLTRIYELSEEVGLWWLIGLIWASSYFTTSITHSLHKIFDTPPPRSMIVRKLFDLAVVAVVVLALSMVALMDTVFSAFTRLPLYELIITELPVLELAEGLLFNAAAIGLAVLLLSALYAYTPRRRLLPGAVLIGAGVAAVMLEGAKHVYTWYITTLGVHEWLYGSLAALMVTVIWFYVLALLFLLGALIVESLDYHWRDGRVAVQEE